MTFPSTYINFETLTLDEILDMKFRDLPLSIEGTFVQECLLQVSSELKAKNIYIPLQHWVSDEFFCADGTLGIAIPFYLLHPSLISIEKSLMGHAEGSSRNECLKILRHELGHVVDNAFNLRRLKKREQLFGSSDIRYPKSYVPKPFSKCYVRHLGDGYAGSHPDEDFAETFAVWLTPGSNWKKRYHCTPALEKLMYMDELMSKVKTKAIAPRKIQEVDPIYNKRGTLRSYYQKKVKLYDKPTSRSYSYLNRVLLKNKENNQNGLKASSFFRANKQDYIKNLASETNQHQYIIKGFIDEIIQVCENRSLIYNPRSKKLETSEFQKYLQKQFNLYMKKGKNRVIM